MVCKTCGEPADDATPSPDGEPRCRICGVFESSRWVKQILPLYLAKPEARALLRAQLDQFDQAEAPAEAPAVEKKKR